jgi:hypothetical protein
MWSRLCVRPVCGALLLVCLTRCGGAARDVRGTDLRCGNHQAPRARSICEAVSQDLEFGWQSGASSAVGYAVTPRTIKKVFCRLRIRADDVPALSSLNQTREEERLRAAARDMLQLLGVAPYSQRSGVYNASDPRYALKGGCSRVF